MNSKVKLVIAVVLFAIAVGAIVFYFAKTSGGISEVGRVPDGGAPAPTPEPAP